ncbi:trypsin-like peptidase domain-containing protein [Magnetococcus marinus]|nr:trypsin-like peptidase domain-containing protein [Magnetococcus marinus]
MLGGYWWADYQQKQEQTLAMSNRPVISAQVNAPAPDTAGNATTAQMGVSAVPVALNQPMMGAGNTALSIPQNVSGTFPFAHVVKLMMPSVVNVSATIMTTTADPNADPKRGLQFANPFSGIATESIGSGIVVTEDGYILSNFHVVENAKQVFVTLFNDQGTVKLPADVIALDSRRDLALLKVEADTPLQPAPFGDSKIVDIGDPVIAIGSPFGLDQTVSKGIISGKRKAVNIGGTVHKNLLQTDAAINRGNSGGPLVAADGSVVGVNTAIYTTTSAFAGVGFAVPSNTAREFLEEQIQLPVLTPLNATMLPVAAPNAPPIAADAVLTHGDKGPCENCHQILPAANAQPVAARPPPPIPANAVMPHGDRGPCENCHQILPAANGQPVAARPPPPIPANAVMPHGDRGPCENCHQILPAANGQPVAMQQGMGQGGGGQGGGGQGMGRHRNRADRMFSFDPNGAFALPAAATLPVDSGMAVPAEIMAIVNSKMGVTFQVLNVELAAQVGSPYPKGLLVDQVSVGSTSDQAGLQKGDVVIKADGKWLDSLAALAELVQAGNEQIRLSVVRGGRREELVIGLAQLQAGPGAQMQPVAMNQTQGMTQPNLGYNLQQPMQQPMQQPSMQQPMQQPSMQQPMQQFSMQQPQEPMQAQNWNNPAQNGATPAWQGNNRAPNMNGAPPKPAPTEFEWMGMEIMPITPARISRQPMLKGKSGGVITDLGAASPAMRAGVQRGDVVVAINGQAVSDGRTIDQAIKAAKGKQWALLEIERNGTRMFVKVQ